MKKIVIILAIGFWSFSALAQNNQTKKAQLEALKIQFITEEVALTEEEGEDFWPLYHSYEASRKNLKRSIRQEKRKLESGVTSDRELLNTLTKLSELECKLSSEKLNFTEKCLPVLGTEKTIKLAKIEDKLRKRRAEKVKTRLED